MTFIYILAAIAVLFFAFKFNALLGAVLTVLMFIYLIYAYRSDYYAIRARNAFSAGNFNEAKRQYKKSIDTGKAKVPVRIEYADTLMRTGNFEEAEQILNNLLRYKLKPEYKNVAKLRRCMAYYKQNNLDEAYDDAMEIYNDGYKTTYLYGLLGYFKLCKSGDSNETLEFCREAYDYNSDDRDITDNLSICHYNRGEYDEAKKLSDKIMEGNPQFVEAYYHGAQIEYALGNYKKVMKYIEKIPSCRWSEMTTVTKAEVEALKNKTQARLGRI